MILLLLKRKKAAAVDAGASFFQGEMFDKISKQKFQRQLEIKKEEKGGSGGVGSDS